MFPQRPMPPMNSRGFFPQQGRMPIGRHPFQGPVMGNRPFTPQMQARGGGLKGLLSRIMPGSQGAARVANPQSFIQGASGATRATGAIQGLANPANISKMLGNVQKALGVAQQVTPMVQQYGPLVKNLPAMIKIYRELKNSDATDDVQNEDDNTLEKTESDSIETPSSNLEKEKQRQKKKRTTSQNTETDTAEEKPANEAKSLPSASKRSKPKMYI
ncbi:VrrA/YqfQ family protein [uncultured Metabacillus sp.]|uniref:VrrA/YqfQ family protein n=1 Tax=uncultured Metabacillus sp. TaxID=2860135 RepID=UPI002630D9BA|nr:VrrA/YqfQ family protein [uncultured Metabacillus sp.]